MASIDLRKTVATQTLCAQVTQEDVQRLMLRYKISNSAELSAKQLSYQPRLEGIFVSLAQEMNEIREKIELTKSAALQREGVITLAEEDWEIITAPEGPVPRYAYRPQEERRLRYNGCRC